MPRMSKKRKLELSFFLNDRGRVAYNDLCRKCQHKCKAEFPGCRDRLPPLPVKTSQAKGRKSVKWNLNL